MVNIPLDLSLLLFASHDQGLHFFVAHTANVANAVAPQRPSANAPPGGPSVEQAAPMTRPTVALVYTSTPNFHPTMVQPIVPSVGVAVFEASLKPTYKHLRWLVPALRRPATCYWFFEVEQPGQVTSTAPFVQLLVQIFRPCQTTTSSDA